MKCFWFEKINTWQSLTFPPQIWQYSNVLVIMSQYCPLTHDPLSDMRWWSYRWSYHWVVDDGTIFKWSRDLVTIWPPCLVLVSLPSVTEATCLLLDNLPLNPHVRPPGPTCDVCCLGQSWEKAKTRVPWLGLKIKDHPKVNYYWSPVIWSKIWCLLLKNTIVHKSSLLWHWMSISEIVIK